MCVCASVREKGVREGGEGEGVEGSHFGDSWARLVLVAPLSCSQSLRGEEGCHCVRIRASCVSAYYMGWEERGGRARDDGENRKSEGGKMKDKMKEWV